MLGALTLMIIKKYFNIKKNVCINNIVPYYKGTFRFHKNVINGVISDVHMNNTI